ncbi:archaellin/type IV pilin N-terminal domain-containing protein [uncultured Methanomethylovorans sp.]|uniref:archaellin/type IV pilin N-terminal domain-containing protein n=1 Tax=uncultured Methanomethylovorans sp. TaxID=183759 RepID=UPI002AA6A56E|nr:archaellin/type IV pilin N-terminal domain-containing protein [uncultured Methanomethylovorans sp.]
MKANKMVSIQRDTSAQVGIGTLIIFIAMVLVAAVAAAVLIQTSGTLQQKAQSTGKQATQEVSSNLQVKSIEGVRAKDNDVTLSSTIDMLKLKISLNVGSSPVDVNQVVVSITDGTTANNLVYAGNVKSYASSGSSNGNMTPFTDTAAANLQELLTGTTTIGSAFNNADHYFVADKIRDEDGSFSQGNPVLNTGDMITMYIATTSSTATGYDLVATTDTSSGLKASGLNLVPRTVVSIILTPESGAVTSSDFITPSSYGVKETVQLYP